MAQNIDNLVVGRALGVTALGFYDKSFMMMNRTVTALSSAGPSVSFRVLSIIGEDDDRFRRGSVSSSALDVFGLPSVRSVDRGGPGVVCRDVRVAMVSGGMALSHSVSRGCPEVPQWVCRHSHPSQGCRVGRSVATDRVQLSPSLRSVLGAAATVSSACPAAYLVATGPHDRGDARLSSDVQHRSDGADIIETQIPALACAAGLVLCLVVLRIAIQLSWPSGVAPLMLLAAGGAVALALCSRVRETQSIRRAAIGRFRDCVRVDARVSVDRLPPVAFSRTSRHGKSDCTVHRVSNRNNTCP